MGVRAHIHGLATALPAQNYPQPVVRDELCRQLFGDDWAARPDLARSVHQLHHLFAAAGVENRQMSVNMEEYYSRRRSTGERMLDYERLSYPLAHAALTGCLQQAGQPACSTTDFIVVSCTGYFAPGLDILLARDLGMPSDVRRLVIGHMGCFGAMVGLRSALATLRAHPGSSVALVTVELCSLHALSGSEKGTITASALFGDAAAGALITSDPDASGPELVDVYCAADFHAAEQMTWKIGDEGFVMGLSRRVPVTLRRNVASVVDNLLTPHGLDPSDIDHWLVHPGGPDVLSAVGAEFSLDREDMWLSWDVLRDHGNCSSSTVLLMLHRLLRSGRARAGEWGLMMAFGPGMTLETCLFRF